MSICKADNCYRNAVRYGYCPLHQRLHIAKPIAKFSNTRLQENKQYVVLRKKFLAAHPSCQIHTPACTQRATVVHHSRGRGKKYYLAVYTWFASCESCNNYVEVHDAWARENGFKKSRLC